MRTATEPVTVQRTVYYADDGTKFTSESACEDYELRKNGNRRECPECHGRGYWQGKFVKGDKSGKLKVHNVVPLDRDQIDAQQYNVLLDKFRKAIIDPYNKNVPEIFRLNIDGESNTEPNADEIAFEFFNDDLVAVKKSAISTLELITDGRQISFDRKEDTDFDFSYNIREYKIVLDVGDPSKFRMLSGKCDPIVRLMGKRDMTRIIIGKDSYGTVWPTNDDGEVTADQNPYQHDSKNGSELVLTFNSTELIC